MLINDARVLLTGASGGIGCALVAALRRRGARLTVSARTQEALHHEESGRAICADLTHEQSIHELVRTAGEIDVLINNAGAGWYGRTCEMPCQDVRRLVEVNLLAPLLLTRLLLPGMLERRRGHIVFIGSVAGHLGVEYEAVYSATKAALGTYAEALRAELRHTGVGVSVISPGAVATEFFRHRGADYQRRWPPAVPPEAVSAAVVRAVERRHSEIFVPHWLRIPALVHGGLPAVYRGLAGRFG